MNFQERFFQLSKAMIEKVLLWKLMKIPAKNNWKFSSISSQKWQTFQRHFQNHSFHVSIFLLSQFPLLKLENLNPLKRIKPISQQKKTCRFCRSLSRISHRTRETFLHVFQVSITTRKRKTEKKANEIVWNLIPLLTTLLWWVMDMKIYSLCDNRELAIIHKLCPRTTLYCCAILRREKESEWVSSSHKRASNRVKSLRRKKRRNGK